MTTLVLITSPPGSAEARRALDLARTIRSQGQTVEVVLLQDAVLTAVDHATTPAAAAVRSLLMQEVPVHVAEYDLVLRGFSPATLAAGARATDDRRLVDLMLAEDAHTLGCF